MLQGSAARKSEGGGLLTVREAAKRLGVNRSTIYGLCERGELDHLRVSNCIRVSAASLVRFLRLSRTRVDARP